MAKDYSIKPRFIKDPKKWHDRCDTLIHYMFEHLCEFVEHEIDHICWYEAKSERKHIYDGCVTEKDKKFAKKNAKDHQKAHAELLKLYVWWTCARPVYIDTRPHTTRFREKNPTYDAKAYWGCSKSVKVPDKAYHEHSKAVMKDYKFEQECEKLDQEMMIRLVKIKQYLWS